MNYFLSFRERIKERKIAERNCEMTVNNHPSLPASLPHHLDDQPFSSPALKFGIEDLQL
jgi:hypothetical protein